MFDTVLCKWTEQKCCFGRYDDRSVGMYEYLNRFIWHEDGDGKYVRAKGHVMSKRKGVNLLSAYGYLAENYLYDFGDLL